MKKDKIWKVTISMVGVFLLVSLMYYANYDRPRYIITEESGTEYETARVREIIEDNTVVDEATEGILRGNMKMQVELLTGRYKGDVVKTINYFGAVNNVNVGVGDTVSVRIDTIGKGNYEVNIYNYDRTWIIIGIVAVFFFTLILIGGIRGFKAVAGLMFTVLCIVFILVPLCLKGFSPVPVTCFIILITNIVCYVLIGGIQTKTVTACIGSVSGVLVAAILAYIAEKLTGITTFQMDEAEALMLIKSTNPLKMRGLFISGILIASMGAVMDISMSIASALDEIHKHNPSLKTKKLFLSGMNIGRDAMGTMANTLVLAFAGNSLNMMIMIYSYGVSFTQLINTDFVSIEVIRAVAGSMGIVLTVPIIAAICAGAYHNNNKLSRKD
ncbi:MAG: YibE/F family protein [Lachnospiraceae bacterium]|nr:YibE/F family protein [Lachnospiraceae bacterium]